MSKFSGKCDLYDWIHIYGYSLEELQSYVEMYVGNSSKPLVINKMSDLVQYYPYIVRSSYVESKRRIAIIRLSGEPWVDAEERKTLEFYKKNLDRIYKRCEREGVNFVAKHVVAKLNFVNDVDALKCIAGRMEKRGTNASIDGIHLKSYDFYRMLLAEEMMKNGINPIKYGYERVMR